MADEKFAYPYNPERHGPSYNVQASAHFAASFVLEHEDEFASWLESEGIDPAGAMDWAKRMENRFLAVSLALGDWGIESPPMLGGQ